MRGALYYAIQEKSIPCVEFLISKGADVAIQDNKGDTIMHVACESNYKNMVQFLLLNGQDYKTPNLSEELPGQNNGEIKALMSEVFLLFVIVMYHPYLLKIRKNTFLLNLWLL